MESKIEKPTASKWLIITLLLVVATTLTAGARKAASDPVIAPIAHTASLTATVAIWANWITAVLAVPLGLLCILYYIAVLYESKLYQKLMELWRSRSRKA